MIRIEGIRKSYGALDVLKGIDLMINKSDIIAIVGRSGAGKTTLLQLLGTLDRPDAGKIYFNNEDPFLLNDKKLSAFRNSHIGFVFQFHQLLPEFTALENVMIPGMIAGKKSAELKSRATHLLEKLRLADRIQHKPSELSGGEQQRVAVARALMNEPELILADEPSGNLDSKNARELHELFLELRRDEGQTFVIVTHNETLAELADRKIVMEDGLIKS
ncbi:MAG: ABC transporter ATP-binding protein [Bacteroidia bacterium]|jgi:lipoprotein-releasing system ATP-binding protein